MPIPAACQSIQDAIDGLRQERNELQEELQHAAPGEKPALLRLIRRLNLQLAGLQKQLEDCIASQPPEPPPLPPIEAIFTGTSELTTTWASAPGPYFNDLRFKMLISGDRTVITIANFPVIGTSFDTPLGPNTTVITRTGGGTGSYGAGAIAMPISLHFDHSIDLPGYEEDSDLSLVLSTDPPGSPVMPEPFGDVTLVGSGQFTDGLLGGSTGTLTIRGAIAQALPDDRAGCPGAAPRSSRQSGHQRRPGSALHGGDTPSECLGVPTVAVRGGYRKSRRYRHYAASRRAYSVTRRMTVVPDRAAWMFDKFRRSKLSVEQFLRRQ